MLSRTSFISFWPSQWDSVKYTHVHYNAVMIINLLI